MPLLYDRTESDHRVVIRYKHLPLMNVIGILAMFAMVCAFLQEHFVVAVVIFAVFFPIKLLWRKPTAEVNAAKLHGSVSVSGSKWSFRNPLTITIPNTQREGIQQTPAGDSLKAAPEE